MRKILIVTSYVLQFFASIFTCKQKLDTISQSAKTWGESLVSANDKLTHAACRQHKDADEINELREKLLQLQHDSDTIKTEFIFLTIVSTAPRL